MVARKTGRANLSEMLEGIGAEPEEQQAKTRGTSVGAVAVANDEEKVSRCYRITGESLERLYDLKGKVFRSKDLSEIVCLAIDRLHKEELGGEK